MPAIYLIRHAQSNPAIRDDRTRPLTAEGLRDTHLITACLRDRGIARILSSPYERTIRTVTHLAEALDLPIETDEDFREREAGGWHGDRFLDFVRSQWQDLDYTAPGGESLRQVQKRNMAALRRAMEKYPGEPLAIATHGTAMGTILNHFDPQWGYQSFLRILDVMPYIVRLEIDTEGRCIAREEILMMQKQWRRP
ncbi:MAG: histidine phosphatase family protein [Clostridiales bacterium]|nr:histidine phosphatase family protein [Clostridiales bacterium]